jgi:succinate-semialdehyde dehydrogenase/glutarate-semialdehyde dehydrogenase
MIELFIHGDWLAADGESVHELIDPATRKAVEAVRSASQRQRQSALEAAQGSRHAWSRRPAGERLASFLGVVDEIRQAAGGLAERQAVESGQPLRECQDLAATAVRRLRDVAANAELADAGPAHATAANAGPACAGPMDARRITPDGVGVQVLQLRPRALWPFWQSTLSAIAGGSTIVCELPANQALTSLAIARCAHQLPPGVLNVVTVDSDERPATDTATEFVFVGQDCYLDVAVAGAATLRLYNTGQRTGHSTRIHVEASLAYKFADRLHEYLAFLEAGDPRKPITDLGPLLDDRALQTATERLAGALKRGAMVKLGGREYQPWGLRGYFLQPTLLVEGVGSERVPHESIPGPVVIVSPTADIGTALRESVGTNHGPLRLSAFTGQADKLDRSLRAASFTLRASAYLPLAERGWARGTTNTLDVELIGGPQPDWFPYKNRRGLKL